MWLVLAATGAAFWLHRLNQRRRYKAANKCPECDGRGYNWGFHGEQTPCPRCEGYAVWVEQWP